MAVAGISRALLKTAIKSLISQGKKIRKKAMKRPLTQDYQYRRGPQRFGKEISERTGPGKYKTAVGEKEYDKFLKDFSKQYKTLGRENFQGFKKQMVGISPDFWLRTQQNALNKGFINRTDTKKVALRAGSELSTKVPSHLAQKQIKLKGDRREAISKVYKQIADEAPTNKAGLPILAKMAFGTKALFPRLKKQFPKLFEGMEDDLAGRKRLRRVVQSSTQKKVTDLTPFPSYLKKPDFVSLSDTSNPTEVYFKKQLRRYTDEGVDKQGDQYFVDQWRSRGPEFRTGRDATDVKNFLEFERRMGTLESGNLDYYKNNPEFKAYEAMRKKQVRGMELSHDRPTLNPLALHSGKHIPTETVPGSGSDIGFTHFLEKDVNRRWQPFYEDKAFKAMLGNRYDKLAAIDAEMIKRNIRTRIIDPNTGEERLMGGWKEFGYKKGGKVDGYAAGGIGRIGIKLLAKLAKKLSPKEMKMLTSTGFKGTNPSKSLAKKRETNLMKKLDGNYNWRNVKSKVPGPRSSVDRMNDKQYPYLDPDNDAFIVSGQSEHPVTGTPQLNKFGRYQLKSTINDTLGSDDSLFRKYSVYDWWDDITETIREKPKFKYVKDSKGNTIMKEVK